jgi:hypothetical protein
VADTTYIVLQREADLDAWHDIGTTEASSADAAIRRVVDSAGTYVAVPARSWKPVTVRTETQTVIRLDTPPAE